jgi:hypothetical protein
MRVLSTIFLFSMLIISALGIQAQVAEDAMYRPSTLVNKAIMSGQASKNVSLFDLDPQESSVADHPVLSQALSRGTLLNLKQKDIAEFRRFPANFVSMRIPTHEGEYNLRLVKVDVVKPGVEVRTSSLGNIQVDFGTHYRGVIENHTNSLVAISVFENEVMGFFSSDEINGNYVIGKIQEAGNAQHIAYRENDLKSPESLDCFTEDDGEQYDPAQLLPRPPTEDVGDCVNVYVEVDFNYYQNYGSSVTTTTNNITGMFNQSITIYANENINMEVSDIFIWTSTSPYSGSASTMRTQFQNQTSSINGDLGHLISYSTGGGGGIAAGFSGICPSNVDQSLCVTQTNGQYATVPTYSRQVKVVTHEMGHLLGSRHTHACVWNGNNTSYDDYGNTNPPSGGSAVAGAEGGACFVSPGKITVTPTIMSYYDSRGWGSFSMGNGFGDQPGNVIRNSVANGNCLAPCGSGGGGPAACTSTISSFPYSNDFESALGWTQDGGDDFDWTRRSGGTPSSGTGPSAASQGTFYAYMEVSSPNYPSRRAILNSPCFDLTGITSPQMTFDYHMLASPGTLDLQASTDGSNWTTIWTRSGDQGSAWNSASVSLNSYTNESELRLRFNGISGSTWQGDIAVDAIAIDGTGGGGGGCTETEVDLTIVLDNYPGETTWSLTDGSGATVASGGPYSTAGATVTETFCLADDCYEFTINDSYGDGICCAYGNGSYALTAGSTTLASGGAFGASETSQIDIGGACSPPCPAIDFNAYTINAYGAGQDAGSSAVQDGGATLFLQNNAWKSISLNYTVTANTVVEFDFRSTIEGEIHGLGFDSDDAISSNLTFKVHGTQNWGITNYDNYSGSSWVTYTIPVGSFYTGSFNRLFFVADHDGGARNGNAYFRNVKIYEGSCGGADALVEPVDQINVANDGEWDFEVYPNPFEEEISVSLPYVENQTAQIDIYNAAGQHVYSQSDVETGREITIQPNVAKGVYIVRVQMGSTQHHIKLIKTK